MAKFSTASKLILLQCHKDLQTVFNEVIKIFDCLIACGRRGEEEQNAAFLSGASKKRWPLSKHNFIAPKKSLAVDADPYPIDWKDNDRYCYFSGFVMATAKRLYAEKKISHEIRWGGDWDDDGRLKEETFRDLRHWEVVLNPGEVV